VAFRAHGRALRRGIWLAAAAWLVLWQAFVLVAPDLDAGPLFSRFTHDGVLLAATALCFWGALASPHGRERRAWLLISAGVAAWTFGELYYTAVLWTAAEIPIPSPADAGYLLFPPLMLLGVLSLLRSRTRNVPGTLWADGVTAALAVAAVCAALVFETVLDSASGQGLEVAVNLAYPLSDLVLLGCSSARWPDPAGSSTGPGCCCSPASQASGWPTPSISSATRTAPTRRARGSTSAGGWAWS
jgi:hypothetical protein